MIFFISVLVQIVVGIPSQTTHWLLFIDEMGLYRPGSIYILQFVGYLYYVAAIILVIIQIRKGKSTVIPLYKFSVYVVPIVIGAILNTKVLRGGYTQISSSVAKRRRRLEEREEEHRLAERRLQTMAEAIHGGFKISKNDAVYTFIMVSDQLAELLGYDSSDELMAKGISLIGVVNPEDAIREMPQARESIRAGEMYTMHYRMRCKDGSWKNVEDRGRLIRKSNGEDELTKKAEALEAANRANESLEKAQKELEASREAAEAANNAKTEFLFNMSHDIRTPMNAIIGYAELMDRHLDDRDKCRDYLEKVKNSSSFLLSLINNVLEMARIESGKIVLNEEVYKPADLYEEITSVYSEMMEQKGIDFTMSIDTQDELYYGDRVKLSQIFLNIISNAYKYTNPGGKISLVTRKIPYDRQGFLMIQTVVTDTGIGMSKEFIPKIFDEFTREHTYTENKIEGTGL